jgi:mono/diheme cytochrome c family protein
MTRRHGSTPGLAGGPVIARVALTGAIIAAGHAATATAQSFPAAQITRGAALYETNCQVCHGVRMKDPPWAIDLAIFPRDNPARFVDSVTNGVRNMPPWGDVLKPDDIQALWAYLVAGEKGN